MKPEHPDFAKRTNISANDLCRIESRDAITVHDAIATVYHDVTDLRASHPSLSDGSIPLEAGYELFISAKRLRVASAAASIRRQGHFRNFPARARDQAREVRLGQTRRGSYIVPIISQARSPEDVYAPQQEHIDIEVEETLFDRRVTATMSRALGVLEEMASARRQPTLSEIADSVGEGVSYELCQALTKVVNTESVGALDITFNWSRVAAPPPGSSAQVEFNRDAIDIVDRISRHLRTQLYTREHVIYGVITDLKPPPRGGNRTCGHRDVDQATTQDSLDRPSRRAVPLGGPLPRHRHARQGPWRTEQSTGRDSFYGGTPVRPRHLARLRRVNLPSERLCFKFLGADQTNRLAAALVRPGSTPPPRDQLRTALLPLADCNLTSSMARRGPVPSHA
ncbi:hypothetical protein SRIMM317S_05183 [Streptomyces rimosus subsp. rimosus]